MTPTDPEELRADVLAETDRLQRLVDGLLLLARRDAATEPEVPRLPVDLAEVVDDEVSRSRRLPVARELAVERGGRLRSVPVAEGARFELVLPVLDT